MQYECLIFDLDGTISDPGTGIARSINYALTHHGFESKPEKEINALIGLPLDQMYYRLVGDAVQGRISGMVGKYRERYVEVGFTENVLYDGVRHALELIHESNSCRLGICTSKRTDVAEKILEMFNLAHRFEFVSGGDVGIDKRQQLAALLESSVITDRSLMIGDRFLDVAAAHSNDLQAAGVLWGYGSRQELEQLSPTYLLEKPCQLVSLIQA